MNINKHDLLILIKRTPETRYIPADRIKCKDGVSLSVQASSHTYCQPREDLLGDYTHVELGFIENIDGSAYNPPEFKEWGDGEDIYAYVPIETVIDFINNHGGVDTKGLSQYTQELLNKLKLDTGNK